MALVDTNCDPDPIDYVIACNDDALKSIKLILQALTNGITERKSEMKIHLGKTDADKDSSDVQGSEDASEEDEG
jgi:small subunit ribosomal protein S2